MSRGRRVGSIVALGALGASSGRRVGSIAVALGALAASAAGCGGATQGSIGAVLGRDEATRAVHVREVPEGLAAHQAGLLPGDEIVMIDGHYVRDLDARRLRELLRGEPGTRVDLTVVRGEAVHRIRVTRSSLRERVFAAAPASRPEDERRIEP